jgi:Isoprenylcysteine carboxyl methyltransferase (ICMT) family
VNLVKSILQNLGVTAVGLIVALVGVGLDNLLRISEFRSLPAAVIGSLLVSIGFFIRVWATYYFYENWMRVIATRPQATLLTSGPYRYSPNPLYLGGNVFIFLLLRRRSAARIASRPRDHRVSPAFRRPLHPARGEAVGAKIRRRVDSLQTVRPPVDLIGQRHDTALLRPSWTSFLGELRGREFP